MLVGLIVTKLKHALAASLNFLLSMRRFGAELVLWADKKLMMLSAGKMSVLASAAKYSF